MAFTFRQLQYFVAVAEQGSVTRAAQNLSISQSSITEAIKGAETQISAIERAYAMLEGYSYELEPEPLA